MDTLTKIAEIVTLLGILGSTVVYFARVAKNLTKAIDELKEGSKCILRSEMLDTYYKHRDTDEFHEYEAQNFELQYAAYKRLGGNSFIDKIHEDVKKWEVVR